jgi:tetratricopeptide (TPR) repeat protein
LGNSIDSIWLNNQFLRADKLIYEDTGKSFDLLDSLVSYCIKNQSVTGLMHAYNLLGINSVKMKTSHHALYYDVGFKIAKKLKILDNELRFLSNTSYIYYDIGDYDKAISLLDSAMVISKKINNKKAISILCLNYAGILI